MSDGTHVRAHCEIALVRLAVMPSKGGLGIESIHLAGSAIHEKKDNVLGFGRKVWWLCGKWICSSAGWRCSRVLCEKTIAAEQIDELQAAETRLQHFEETGDDPLFMMISIRVDELVHIENDAA